MKVVDQYVPELECKVTDHYYCPMKVIVRKIALVPLFEAEECKQVDLDLGGFAVSITQATNGNLVITSLSALRLAQQQNAGHMEIEPVPRELVIDPEFLPQGKLVWEQLPAQTVQKGYVVKHTDEEFVLEAGPSSCSEDEEGQK